MFLKPEEVCPDCLAKPGYHSISCHHWRTMATQEQRQAGTDYATKRDVVNAFNNLLGIYLKSEEFTGAVESIALATFADLSKEAMKQTEKASALLIHLPESSL